MAQILIIVFYFLLLPNSYGNLDPKLSGEQIAQKVFDLDNGESAVTEATMVLIHKGNRRERKMIMVNLDQKNLSRWSMIKFLDPKDIKNTALLTIDLDKEESQQWLYLPSLQKIRTIASSGKGKSFVGSDIFYEDLETRKVAEDHHKRLPDGKYQGIPCYRVESIPKDPKSTGYSQMEACIHPDSFLPLEVVLYIKGKKAKIIRSLKREKIQNFWTTTNSEFEDLISGHKTLLEIIKIKYNVQIGANFFSTRNLEHSDALDDLINKSLR